LYVVLLATDFATAKDFFHLKLGLELLDEGPHALRFRSGSTELSFSKSKSCRRHLIEREPSARSPGRFELRWGPSRCGTAGNGDRPLVFPAVAGPRPL
jgi:hypothetical protein